jgi:hypothetical protein
MSEQNKERGEREEFNPSDHKADEVVEKLEEASEEERLKIAAAEQADKGRKSVLEAAGVEGDVRLDASGRRLHPWEVLPKKAEN